MSQFQSMSIKYATQNVWNVLPFMYWSLINVAGFDNFILNYKTHIRSILEYYIHHKILKLFNFYAALNKIKGGSNRNIDTK